MAPLCDIPTGLSTKKALLIGISYSNGTGRSGQTLSRIPTSIPNVKKFKAHLQEHWGYTDIVVMTDEEGVDERLLPTKANLKREMRAFSHGAKPGDRRVFYFAGHSDQMVCKTGSEEDGMDEVLVALHGLRIRDNTLHNWMVKGLPKGSTLTAIFDSCTSGTMLDLEHYRCNGVYYPWVNKGERNSRTLHNVVVRRNGRVSRSRFPSQPLSRMGSLEGVLHSPGISQVMQTKSFFPPLPNGDPNKHRGERTTSPERRFCDGWCRDNFRQKGSLQHADVISISSSSDGQTSWDASTRNGDSISMTNSLVKILGNNKPIAYSEFMTLLNHQVHSYTRRMHGSVREDRRSRRRGEGKYTDSENTDSEDDKGEMNNFQELQLGSITPVDMDRIFMF